MEPSQKKGPPPENGGLKSTEDLMRIYRQSLKNMKEWLRDSPMRLDEKLGILDAWQEELKAFYRQHGHCFACDQPLPNCRCEEPLDQLV